MAKSDMEKETVTAPVVEVRYCGPRESQFASSVPRCTFRTTGNLQSLKRHFEQKQTRLGRPVGDVRQVQ